MMYYRKNLGLASVFLSLSIFATSAIERSFATIAKMPEAPSTIFHGMEIYMYTLSIGALAIGWLFDNVNARPLLSLSCFLVAIGILFLPSSSLVFGLCFGLGTVVTKLAPFSAPLKLKDKWESLWISPQSAAKNFGPILFLLFLGNFLTQAGFDIVTVGLVILSVFTGICIHIFVPDDKIVGWKASIFAKLAKDYKFWILMVYFFFTTGLHYTIVMQLVTMLKAAGFSSSEAVTAVALGWLGSGIMRVPVAYLGDRFGHGLMLVIGLAGFFAVWGIMSYFPLLAVISYFAFSSIHTPNYWGYIKKRWTGQYVATLVAFGYFFMYVGAGIMVGKWVAS